MLPQAGGTGEEIRQKVVLRPQDGPTGRTLRDTKQEPLKARNAEPWEAEEGAGSQGCQAQQGGYAGTGFPSLVGGQQGWLSGTNRVTSPGFS